MASLQARHTRQCGIGKAWTPFAAATKDSGCTCTPTYYTVGWADGKPVRTRVGQNRKNAERALPPVQADELRGDLEVIKGITFEKWADQWLSSLTVKPSTINSYTATMRKAKDVFGSKQVRRLTTEDVHALIAHVSKINGAQKKKERATTTSTRAKHLRALSACLSSAVVHGYASRNVVSLLPANETPKRRKAEAAFFTDDELPRLFAELRHAGGYRVLCMLALKTGMRLGEMSALTWGDCDLGANEIRIRRTFTEGAIGTPKSGKPRRVEITDEIVELLGAWWGELGKPADDTLVLPGDTKTGYLNPQVVLRRELYPAMTRAGIPRADANGELRTFHSFRHTHARIALENGMPLAILSEHLGHSSVIVTATVYAHVGKQAAREHAQALQGAFPV